MNREGKMERTNHLRGTRLFVFIILIIIFTIYAYAVLPTVSISASPLTIKLGESATLSWTSANATSASIDNGIGSVAVNGSRVVKPTKTATYTITVSGSGGSATAKVTVTVIQPVPSVSITATPEKIQEYGSASLAWVSAYATSATIDNSIGAVAINGSKIVTPSKTTTYTITVSGEGGTNSASVTVSLEIKPKCYAYIPNSYDGTVSVIDTLTNQIATTISVGSEPKGVALSPDKTRAYISLRDYVAILDTNTNTLLDKISVPGANKYMAIHANGIFLYIPGSRLENGNWKYFINVIDTGSKAVVREIPVTGNIYGLAVHPDGTRLYACNYSQNKIAVINAATFEALNDIPLRLPWDLVFKPDGSRFYVIQGYDASLENFSVMDAATHSLVAGLRLAQTDGVTATPLALRVHPDGSRVYVTRNDDKFSVIDAASNSVIGTVPIVGQAANAIGVHPDGSRLYIVCTNSNWLRVFNTSGYTAIATVNLGHAPYGLGNFIGFNATTISGKITKSGTGSRELASRSTESSSVKRCKPTPRAITFWLWTREPTPSCRRKTGLFFPRRESKSRPTEP